MTDTDQSKEDNVLRRMLATAPSPHKPKKTGLTPMKATKPTPHKPKGSLAKDSGRK